MAALRSGRGRWFRRCPQRHTAELGNAFLVCWGVTEPETDRRRIGDARECRLDSRLGVIVRRLECHVRPQDGPPRGGSNRWGANTSWVDYPDIENARSNWRCVWPQTSVLSSIPASASAHAAERDSGARISSSLRGVAWQKSTDPSPSTSMDAVRGQEIPVHIVKGGNSFSHSALLRAVRRQ